ncbi:MAG TPA: hypothetical protein VGG71_01960 [Chitinophagaceae bacterium]
MPHSTHPIVICILLLIGMIVMVLLGRGAGQAWNKGGNEPKGGVNSLLAALFALSGLILAFAFGMSETHLERVRDVIENEANAISTAISRADLYPDSVRQTLRIDFKKYLEAVIDFYENKSLEGKYKAVEQASKAGDDLWSIVTQKSKLPNMFLPSTQMTPALNSMFDAAQSRAIVLKSGVPFLIGITLFICLLATCFVAGFTSAAFHKKEWIIIFGFVLVATIVVYTTIDLARPLQGLIGVEAGKKAIVDLREMFQE